MKRVADILRPAAVLVIIVLVYAAMQTRDAAEGQVLLATKSESN